MMKKILKTLFFVLGGWVLSFPVSAQLAAVGFKAALGIFGTIAAAKFGVFDSILWGIAGNGSFCWFCPLLGATFEVLNNIATIISDELQELFVDLLAIGVLFFIVFKVAKLFTQMTEASVSDFATELVKPLLRSGFVFIVLLLFPYFLFEWIVTPVTNISLGLVQESFQKPDTKILTYVNNKMKKDGHEPFSDMALNMCAVGSVEKTLPDWMHGKTQGKALGVELRNQLLSFVCNFSASSVIGIALGVAFLTQGATDITFGGWGNLSMMFTGMCLLGVFLFLFAFLPFKFIDILLHLCFVLAFTPLFLVFWVFPLTVQYTMRGWSVLLSSLLSFFFISVVATIAGHLLGSIIPNRDLLLQALIGNNITEAASLLSVTTMDCIMTLLICFLCPHLFNAAETLANAFGSVPISYNPLSNIGVGVYLRQLGLQGVQGVTSAVGGVTKFGVDKVFGGK